MFDPALRHPVALSLCGLLTLVVLAICTVVETLNHCAGGNVLPNREGGKLRLDLRATETGWRLAEAGRRHDPTLAEGRPLGSAERQAFHEQSRRAVYHNRLVSLTRGPALAQYLLAPLAGLWSVVGFARLRRVPGARVPKLLAGVFGLANTVCLVLLFHRGYFNS